MLLIIKTILYRIVKKKFHVKYDDNGLKRKRYTQYIHLWVFIKSTKIFVGFAFYDNTHHNNSFNNYNGYIKNDNNNNLLSNLVFSFQPSTHINR